MKAPKANRHAAYAILRASVLSLAMMFSAACTGRGDASDIGPAELVPSAEAVNINTAGAEDLERIPHIGPGLAQKIVEHRERYGPFRKIEHLMTVDGIGDSRFRKMRRHIKAE